ncbi:hypothetical protein CC2G_003341 [Coprinopsis cinerea AmutBmut pab1-1]|nr:hypothetical protein CC2G_003341 [Coprinopsis cinerea AmutBmut pab1-1]
MSTSQVNGEARQLVWLITGTSSGFGKRLVKSVLSRGDRVIATARSLDKLSKTLLHEIPESLNENLKALELDITEGEASLKAKAKDAASYWGRIDVLVNNAGFGLPGFFEEGGSTLFRRQFESNVFAMVDMVTVTLPYIRASKGTIVNVGSRSAWKTEIAGLGKILIL